jgi:hypothetical protein
MTPEMMERGCPPRDMKISQGKYGVVGDISKPATPLLFNRWVRQ